MIENRRINPWTWQDAFGFSQAIETSGHTRVLRIAGQASTDANGAAQHSGDMAKQLGVAIDNLETVLKASNMSLGNLVRLTLYTTDIDAFMQNFEGTAARLAAADARPAMTLIGVARLFQPELMIEIDGEAVA